MILLTLIFKLGVRFAIFNFIWFFLELLHKMLTGMRPPFLAEHYILKALKYVLLVSITFAYCLEFAPTEVPLLSNCLPKIWVEVSFGKFLNKFRMFKENCLVRSCKVLSPISLSYFWS